MSATEQQFFALLRSGLWGKPVDSSLFEGEVDWPKILKLASMQTVSGVVFDGVSNLSSDLQPPVETMRRLYQMVVRIEQSHVLLNDRLTRLVSLLQGEGIDPILLKGQGVARNYPNPFRRQCGDIDLYIGKEEYNRACELVERWGIVSGDRIKSYKHFHFDWDGVGIELHRLAEELPDPIRNKRFQDWSYLYLQTMRSEKWILDDTGITLPPVQFNALYIFNHAFLHFISDGIGFRQLSDWVLHLHRYHDTINIKELKSDLISFGLLRPWQIFGCIAVHELGLEKEKFPFYNEQYRDIAKKHILNDILLLGNFGQFDPKWQTRPKNYLAGKLHNFKMKSRRILQLYPIVRGYIGFYYFYFFFIGVRQIVDDRLKP